MKKEAEDLGYTESIGLEFTLSIAIIASVLILIFTYFHFSDNDSIRHMLSTPQRNILIASIAFYWYVNLGGIFFVFVEGWDWETSVNFTFVTVTSIGYGDVAPTHWVSKLFFMLYYPLGFVCLAYLISVLWRNVLHKFDEALVKYFDIKIMTDRQAKGYQAARIIFCLFLLALLWSLGALLFWYNEGWRYLDALYFTFVTITTIGYGDFVPSSATPHFVFVMFVLCAIGILSFVLAQASEIKDQYAATENPKQSTASEVGVVFAQDEEKHVVRFDESIDKVLKLAHDIVKKPTPAGLYAYREEFKRFKKLAAKVGYSLDNVVAEVESVDNDDDSQENTTGVRSRLQTI